MDIFTTEKNLQVTQKTKSETMDTYIEFTACWQKAQTLNFI